MTFSLYDAVIPTNLQIIAAVQGLLDKAVAHCTQAGLAEETLIQCKLAEDMFPFAYQVASVAGHSFGAIEGVRKGTFGPDVSPPPASFAALKQRLTEAQTGLGKVTPAELNSFIGRDMRFEFREYRMDFTAENFLLSFSQPNFFFHAATAYDLLRMKGVAVGKSDFMGPMRIKS